jgi:hypothetical protein
MMTGIFRETRAKISCKSGPESTYPPGIGGDIGGAVGAGVATVAAAALVPPCSVGEFAGWGAASAGTAGGSGAATIEGAWAIRMIFSLEA